MIDFKGICDNLASRFEAATLGTPSGAPAVLATFGQMPAQTPALPAVVVVPQHGTVVTNDQWNHRMRLRAYLLLSRAPGNPATVEAYRQEYLPYMLAATEGQMKLGLGAQSGWELKSAIPAEWGWGEEDMAGTAYDAVWVEFEVWVNETVSLVP